VKTRAFICTALALVVTPAGVDAKPTTLKQTRATTYSVGVATRSINPNANGTFAGQPVYLGGYGIGGGSPLLSGRPATGSDRATPRPRATGCRPRTR
jgi:hypothetical protein